MAADATLKVTLIGQDKSASRALQGVGREAHQTQGKMAKFGAIGKAAALGIAGALVGVGVAAAKFGADSLAAYADADKSQKKLEDAYKRFPKVANVGIEALRAYNQQLQRKTGADADDLAAAQAQLAAFKLNGKQIKSMSPLLIDYANKTGKTLPDAAKTLGKATLGNTKALKDLGISYKSTKDPAKDYANIMSLLRDKVGGYTDSIPEAEKKQKILQASFGDLQEAVGEKLQPAMIGLIDAGQGVLDWLDQNPEAMAGAAAAWDLFTQGVSGLWFVVRKFVAPALGFLIHGAAAFVDGIGAMLDALGNVPGFEWAKDAAAKVHKVSAGIEAVADGLDSLANDPAPKVDVEDKATPRLKKVRDNIKDLKGKIVKAEAKGDDKGLRELKKKLRDAEKEKHKLTVLVNLQKANSLGYYAKVSPGSSKIYLRAGGGSVRRGQPYIVGENEPELFVPGESGQIYNGAQMRRRASAAAAVASSMPSGGDTYVFKVDARGSMSDLDFAAMADRAMTKLVRTRRGRAPQFMLAVAK